MDNKRVYDYMQSILDGWKDAVEQNDEGTIEDMKLMWKYSKPFASAMTGKTFRSEKGWKLVVLEADGKGNVRRVKEV